MNICRLVFFAGNNCSMSKLFCIQHSQLQLITWQEGHDQTMTKESHRAKKRWRYRFRIFKRKRFNPFWQSIKWPVIGGFLLFGLILGYMGFNLHATAIGEDSTGADFVYRSIRLIGFRSGDVKGPLSWQLEVSRFLVPLLAAYAAIQGLIALFHDQWQQLRVRFLKNHVVLCGLGERGLRFVEEFLDYGCQVVVIEEDEGNIHINHVREQGAFVIIGNARDEYTLRRAGVHKARYLVAVCPDDGTNAEIALYAHDLASVYPDRTLTAFVDIVNTDLSDLLSCWSLTASATDSFRLEFFNVVERGAQLILSEHPPFRGEIAAGEKAPRILIVGLGKVGRRLVVQAAKLWLMKQENNGKRLRVSIVDRFAESELKFLNMQYPQLAKACEFDLWQIEKNVLVFRNDDLFLDQNGYCDFNTIYVCSDDDVLNLVNALALQRKTRNYKIPIVMEVSRVAGLATLVNKTRENLDLKQVYVFGLLDKTCRLEALFGGTHEMLARIIHDNYVKDQMSIGVIPETNPYMFGWNDLPESIKESNRYQASQIIDKLKAVGCSVQPLFDWGTAAFSFTPEEIERMAEMEHKRWHEERRKQGWSYSKSVKDIRKKTSPHLVSWEDLPEEVKEFNRNTARELPAFLALAGLQICRKD